MVSPTRKREALKRNLARLESNVEDLKSSAARKNQDISTSSIKNLTMGNLSAIHEERETYAIANGGPESKARIAQEEDEEDLIDFMSHPDPDHSKKNKNYRPPLFAGSLEERDQEEAQEWDD